jgi:acyl dehydratase
MQTRELATAPRMLPLYVRAVAPLIPGASRVLGLADGDRPMPELELALSDARADQPRLEDYERVCLFTQRHSMPATYPHVLAFPLQLALLTDRRFPFVAVGLVHVANTITQHRAIPRQEILQIRVSATAPLTHARGRSFALKTEVRCEGELVWEEISTMLHRERPGAARDAAEVQQDVAADTTRWELQADLGRRYAAVSGDRNPIHLTSLTARAFGFPRAIAHGMWTMARCIAALEDRLADAFTVNVRFSAPILLPNVVGFGAEDHDGAVGFSVFERHGARTHLHGQANALPDVLPPAEEQT